MDEELALALERFKRDPRTVGSCQRALRAFAHAGRLDEGVRAVRHVLASANDPPSIEDLVREACQLGWGFGDPLFQSPLPLVRAGRIQDPDRLVGIDEAGGVRVFETSTGIPLLHVPHRGTDDAPAPLAKVANPSTAIRAFPGGAVVAYVWGATDQDSLATWTRILPDLSFQRVWFRTDTYTPPRLITEDEAGELFSIVPSRGNSAKVRIYWEPPARVEALAQWPEGLPKRDVRNLPPSAQGITIDRGEAAVYREPGEGGGSCPWPHRHSIERVQVLDGGDRVATHDLAGQVVVWQASTGDVLAALESPDPNAQRPRAAVDLRGRWAVLAGPREVRALSLASMPPRLLWTRSPEDLSFSGEFRDLTVGGTHALVVANDGQAALVALEGDDSVTPVETGLTAVDSCGVLERGGTESFWVLQEMRQIGPDSWGPVVRQLTVRGLSSQPLGEGRDRPPLWACVPAKATREGLFLASGAAVCGLGGASLPFIINRGSEIGTGAFALRSDAEVLAWVVRGEIQLYRRRPRGACEANPFARLRPESYPIRDLAFSGDGTRLLFTQGCHVRFWDYPDA